MTARNTTTRDKHRGIIRKDQPPCHWCHEPIDYQAHPSSEVRLYAGATLVAVFPSSLEVSDRWLCRPSLCCYCDLMAHYTVGDDHPCGEISASFVQAVARLFTYIAENRGDVELDDQVLGKSGAKAFLDLTYVA